jgi:hypothetical protein
VVRWLPGRSVGKEIIVSGAVDHSVRVWREDGEGVCVIEDVTDEVYLCAGY